MQGRTAAPSLPVRSQSSALGAFAPNLARYPRRETGQKLLRAAKPFPSAGTRILRRLLSEFKSAPRAALGSAPRVVVPPDCSALVESATAVGHITLGGNSGEGGGWTGYWTRGWHHGGARLGVPAIFLVPE